MRRLAAFLAGSILGSAIAIAWAVTHPLDEEPSR